MKSLSNKDIEKIIKKVKNNKEEAMLEYCVALLTLTLEIRNNIQKDNQCKCKTDPLKLKKGDVLIG